MSIIKKIIELLSFFLIGLPIALLLYITNEIYWEFKRMFK